MMIPLHILPTPAMIAGWITGLMLINGVCAASQEVVTKMIIKPDDSGANQLSKEAWRPWKVGFSRQDDVFTCDNGTDRNAQRGVSQTIELNQAVPAPIIASAWSRGKDVTGTPDSNYSLYLDLVYRDGTHLWGQQSPFDIGTHDWQQRRVVILPEKPVRHISFHMLFRDHGGQAWFRQPHLETLPTPAGAALFDGVPVSRKGEPTEGFQLRDAKAAGNFVRLETEALGVTLQYTTQERAGTTLFDVTISDTGNRDRAVTLLYTIPIPAEALQWLDGPRQERTVTERQEFTNTGRFRAGANGRLSRYPLGAVANARTGTALAIDMATPAFFRIGYSGGTQELYLAYDIALAPEKPEAHVRFCRYSFNPEWKFRAALDRYYETFPAAFHRREFEHGLWMPFAKISQVKRWEDFGFKFKEGNNETAWDDQHDIITFRYTEPMTWWMNLPTTAERNLDSALQHARKLGEDPMNLRARALFNSGYHNQQGQLAARVLDTPWCNGAVWSINSMPNLTDKPTDFSLKWNEKLIRQLYGPDRKADLDGEYIDSSEGYVTDELDFCRAHFSAADTPLCYSLDTREPAIFRGLIAFEYARAIAEDIHRLDKLMMANSTPIRLCWLAPQLDVLGSETNWHVNGQWHPMSDADLLFRRAMCKTKPYCFLMNTRFEDFSNRLVEKYMKRSLAYGFFPGFFSHNASQGHYFSRPELYERDRSLFKKYVPLCRRLSEAGWQPITGARSSDEQVLLERFGDRFLTVFNSSSKRCTTAIQFAQSWPGKTPKQSGPDLTGDHHLDWSNGILRVTLAPEDVAVIDVAMLAQDVAN